MEDQAPTIQVVQALVDPDLTIQVVQALVDQGLTIPEKEWEDLVLTIQATTQVMPWNLWLWNVLLNRRISLVLDLFSSLGC